MFAEEIGRFIFLRLRLQVHADLLPLRPIEQEGPVRSVLKIWLVVGGFKIINVVIEKSHITPARFGIVMPKTVLKGFVGWPRDLQLLSVGSDRIVVG